jgi:hypothetical protein
MQRKPWHIREDADPVLVAMVTELLPALDAYCAKRPTQRLRVRFVENGVVTSDELIVMGGTTKLHLSRPKEGPN